MLSEINIDEFPTVCSLCEQYGTDRTKDSSYPTWNLRGQQPGESDCFMCRRRERLKAWFIHLYEGGERTFDSFNRRERAILRRHGDRRD